MKGIKLAFLITVKPTTTKSKIASTLTTTRIFSTLEALETPKLTRKAANKIANRATKSNKPPSTPNGLAKLAGSFQPSGAISARKLADKPELMKAIPIKYSASKAQPENQPQNSPKMTLIQE